MSTSVQLKRLLLFFLLPVACHLIVISTCGCFNSFTKSISVMDSPPGASTQASTSNQFSLLQLLHVTNLLVILFFLVVVMTYYKREKASRRQKVKEWTNQVPRARQSTSRLSSLFWCSSKKCSSLLSTILILNSFGSSKLQFFLH